MANVIKTVITYPLNGSTRDFNIPFEYLARKFIQVTLIGRDRKPLTNIDDYRFTSKNQITTNRAWGTGDGYQLIELRRFTSATERLVDFSDGSILRAYDLNVSQIQTLHVAEEARDLTADTIGVNNDGDLDARGRRIVNLADPVNEMDAVNLKTIKEWNNGAYQSYLKAKEEAEKAARSATAAKTSETNARASEANAKASETNAKASENSAKSSETNAKASADRAALSANAADASQKLAKDSEAYTKQQADRSYNEAERAKGYADSMGSTIDIGKTIESINTSTNEVIWKGSQLSKEIGVGYSRVPGVASPVARFGYDNDTAQTPRMYMSDQTGGVTLTFPWETGTFATREWTNTYVSKTEAGGSQLQTNGSSQVIAVNPNGNAGFWHTTERRWTFRVGSDNIAYMSVNNIEVSAPNGYSGIKLVGKGGWYSHLETDGNRVGSTYLVTRNAQGQNMYHVMFPQEASGVLATQSWVNSQGFVKTSGTKLGPVVTGSAVALRNVRETAMTAEAFEQIMLQVPGNAVFCGVTFSTISGMRNGSPKWRVITG